jgi:hypothetical protein
MTKRPNPFNISDHVDGAFARSWNKIEVFQNVAEKMKYEAVPLRKLKRCFQRGSDQGLDKYGCKELFQTVNGKYYDICCKLALEEFESSHDRVAVFERVSRRLNHDVVDSEVVKGIFNIIG